MAPFLIAGIRVGAVLPLERAAAVAAAAQDAGIAAVRVLDGAPAAVLDPSAVASFLAGRYAGVGWIVDSATTHNAPYNLARRALSLDRATGGRGGLALRLGEGDEVSDAAIGPAPGASRVQRWSEYAQVVAALWASFPAGALLGDQEGGVFAEDGAIVPISHRGGFYRVAGPLDGPASRQGAPVLVGEDVEQLGWDRIAAAADVVVVPAAKVAGASAALADALWRKGRRREEVALVARVEVDGPLREGDPGADVAERADRLADWSASYAVDGLEVVISGGAERAEAVVRGLGARFGPAPGPTLRAALGLPERVEVAA
jgi:hypothetical protein